MLCQYTVKNFQCIKDEVTLDMQATNITEHTESIITDPDGESFLPLCAIYGPNGGGKTTVLHSLFALARKIMMPICAVSCNNTECIKNNSNIIIEPYRFSKATLSMPTEFELFFRTHKYEFQYTLSVLKDKVVAESLSKKIISSNSLCRYSSVFDRKELSKITLHGSLKKYDVSGISDTITLLSFLGITHGRNGIIKDIIAWFDNFLEIINYGNPQEDHNILIGKGSAKELTLKMLAEMDIDITDYRTIKKDDRLNIFTTHTINGERFELPFSAESSGTIKVFSILPHIAKTLKNGGTIIIDELDAKLHPLLLKYIISLFRDPNKNKKKAQLVFTSHDMTTMNSEMFRRDEIWFIAKNIEQSAQMYSLAEIKERKGAAYWERYINGNYGADPYLKNIIQWGES